MPLNKEDYSYVAEPDEKEEALHRAVDCVLDNAKCNNLVADCGFTDSYHVNDVYNIDVSGLNDADHSDYHQRLDAWLAKNRGKDLENAFRTA